jgi:hypothetical protein
MANTSLDNSARAEKPFYASRILFTHFAEGYAVLRVALGDQFTKCNPSVTHEYLWALSELIEQAKAELDGTWKGKLRELERLSQAK